MGRLKIRLLQIVGSATFFLIGLPTFAQPNISGVVISTSQVDVNEVVEIDFRMRYYNEPHNPDVINAYCEFRNKNTSTVKVVQAFYYVDFAQTVCEGSCSNPCEILDIIPQDAPPEGINTEEVDNHDFGDFFRHGYWKVRFTPEEIGDWEFTLYAHDAFQSSVYNSDPAFDEFESLNTNKPGFIVKANDRYLKRKTGEFYFPVGVNVPTYGSCYAAGASCGPGLGDCEFGTIEYKKIIDEIASENGNFFRVHVNIPGSDDTRGGLSLFGKDFLFAHPYSNKIFKFDMYNLKDAWQMDEIIKYAKQKDIALEIVLFVHSYFGDLGYCDNAWTDANPFNSNFGGPIDVNYATDIFDINNATTIAHTKNLIRYMVSRWGAYTSVANWKLWGEAEHVKKFKDLNKYPAVPSQFDDGNSMAEWHEVMYNYIKTIDPFMHPITSSYGDFTHKGHAKGYDYIDLLDWHYYEPLNDGNTPPTPIVNSQWNLAYANNYALQIKFLAVNAYGAQNIKKPILIGETGWWPKPGSYDEGIIPFYDPTGYDFHSTLWSTAVSGSYGCGVMWEYKVIDKEDWYHHFKPVATFMNSQPILPGEMIIKRDTPPEPLSSGNGLFVYTMSHVSIPDESVIYGWCQDANFTFKELAEIPNPTLPPTNYLKDLNPNNKPLVSSSFNEITLEVGAPNLLFVVEWYSSETGELYSSTTTTSYAVGSTYYIDIEMPLALRTSKYGDAVFKVERNCSKNIWREGAYINSVPQNTASNTISSKLTGQTFYGTTTNTINSYWWNGTVWSYVDFGSLATDVAGDLAMSNSELFIYYRSLNNNIKAIWWDASASTWKSEDFTSLTNGNVKGPIVIGPNEEIYYRTNTDDINALIWNGSSWTHSTLNNATIGNVDNSIVVASNGQIFYRTTNDAMNQLWKFGSTWVWGNMSNTVPAGSINSNITIQPNTTKLYWIDTDNEINYVEYDFNIPNWVAKGNPLNWYSNASGDLNAIDNENVIFRNQQGDINLLYFENNEWKWSGLVDNNPEDMVAGTGLAYDDFGNIAYRSTNNTIRRLYYKSICFNTPSTSFQKNDPTTMGTKNLEEKESNKVKIYPNPSNGKFTISSETSIEKWVLKNAIGVSVLTSDKLLKNSDTIDATNLSAGIYFITIVKSNGQESNHKIIIK